MEISMTKSKHLIFITSLIVTICSSGSAYAYNGYRRADIYCSEYSSIVKNDEQRLEGYLWYLTGFLVGLNFQKETELGAGVNVGCLMSEMNRFCEANPKHTLGDGLLSLVENLKSQNSTINQCDLGTTLTTGS